MEYLHAEDGELYMLQNVAAGASPPDPTEEGVFYDYNRGNPGWADKVSDFETYVANGWHAANVDIAINKFCYIDQDADWATYRASMETLESTYPTTTFVYMTIPITTAENSEDGWLRQQFNANLRTWIATQDNKCLLDIADIEAHAPDGSESTSIWDGHVYQTLQPGYTSDGGHLNETGQQRMGTAMYSLLALIADHGETPVPDTDLALIWHGIRNGQAVYWRIAETGKLVSEVVNTGWGFISDSSLSSNWNLVSVATHNSNNVLFWQNGATGKVAYWTLNDNYQLSDEEGGWGFVSDELLMDSGWAFAGVAATGEGSFLLWQDLATGDVVYWKLNADSPTITNSTQNDGWGYVDDEVVLNSNWRLAAAYYDAACGQVLTWQNQLSGKVVWWKLTDSCKLVNRTQDDGWGFVSDEVTLNSNWRLVGRVVAGANNLLIWRNEVNSKAVWWKLQSDSCVLQDSTKDSGWGFVAEDIAVNSNWNLVQSSTLGDELALFWRQEKSGQVVWWKLDDTGTIIDATQDSGWGFVSDNLAVSSNWRIAGVIK